MGFRGTLRSKLTLAFVGAVAAATGAAGTLAYRVSGPDDRTPVLLSVVAIGVVGLLVAWVLARALVSPLDEVARAVESIARGDAGPIKVRAGGDIGRIAAAVNRVSGRLHSSLAELQASRDELRGSVRRLGETLRSTHDLTRLLSVVLDTAAVSVGARSGVVYLLTARRDTLFVKVARNLDHSFATTRVALGEGVAGYAAERRVPLLVAPGSDAPALSASEPPADTVVAVPLETTRQPIGVLVLYGRQGRGPFGVGDLELIGSLAGQAAVGIENVLLHQEAERLSITDGLTGVWNHRYFDMRLAQEVERGIRFQHDMSLVMVDIDNFKQINDRHGHQRGNEVLIELAQRIVRTIRTQVDTLARYGGDEFVLILPETPLDGAHIVAQKICDGIAGEVFLAEGQQPLAVSISVGVSCFPQHGATAQTVLQAADRAMYVAKSRGRNRVVTADEAYDPPSGVA